jgi:hypothetical protein
MHGHTLLVVSHTEIELDEDEMIKCDTHTLEMCSLFVAIYCLSLAERASVKNRRKAINVCRRARERENGPEWINKNDGCGGEELLGI